MNEAHVSFELAKLLKERGFKEECKYFYDWSEDTGEPRIHYLNGRTCNSNDYPSHYSMPSVRKVKEWIKDKYGIQIETHIDKNNVYYTSISTEHFEHSVDLCSDLQYEDHTELVLKYILKKFIYDARRHHVITDRPIW